MQNLLVLLVLQIKRSCISPIMGYSVALMELKDSVICNMVDLLRVQSDCDSHKFIFISSLELVVCALSGIYNGYRAGVHSSTVSERR